MRALLVVVRHKFTEDRQRVLLVEDDDVVEALAAQGADRSFGDCVGLWRVDRK
jgi:hypothetical protein